MQNLSPEKIKNELSDVRSRISEIHDEIEWTENTMPPKQELFDQWSLSFDEQAEQFKFSPQYFNIFNIRGAAAGHGGVTSNMGPLLCFLLGGDIKTGMKTKIDALDYQEGPSLLERPALVEGLNAELFKLEQRAEELIVMANNIGIHISRSDNFDPAVVLGFNN